jgi:methyl-accepting chemotaxis protein
MAMSFKTKIIGSVVFPTVVLIALSAVALAFNAYQNQQQAAAEKVRADLDSVQRLLDESARLMMTKTTAAMNVLQDITGDAGKPSAGAPADIVPGVSAPNITFGKEPQALNFRIVDKVVNLVGGTATIFSKSGDSFVRIATNVKKQDGSRAVGTVLDPLGPAFASLKDAHGFEGVVDILGNPFFTSYQPIVDSDNKLVGIYYVGYEASLGGVQTAIQQAKILNTGFLVLADGKGKVRFTTNGIPPDQAAATINTVPEGWQVDSRDVAGWNYKVFAAYPKAELREGAITTAEIILGGGVILALLLSVLVGVLIESMVISPLGGDPSLASAAMAEISSGNLDADIGKAKHGSLLGNLSLMQEKLHNIVNTIHKAVAKSSEQHAKFNETIAAFQAAKSLSPERQKIAEEALLAAAEKVAKSDETVSRAVDRLKI